MKDNLEAAMKKLLGGVGRGAIVPFDGAGRTASAADEPAAPWTETLNAVVRAGGLLNEREARIRQLEKELADTLLRSSEEVRRLEARNAEVQARLDDSEAQRAQAEEWLARLHKAVTLHFSPTAREDEPASTARVAS
jgi:hypothetical protein